MRVYKLTDANDRTHGDTQWGEGIPHEAPGTGELCTAGWIHCYTDPLLAVLLNPIHGNFADPHLWEAEADGATKDDHGIKLGVQKLTTLRQISVPVVTTEQRVRFGILCAKRVCKNKAWLAWAEGWLTGKDRSARAEAAAAEAAEAAEAAATWAAAEAAAAEAAAEEAAARAAARAAAEAADAADIDLVAIAQQVMKEDK